MDLLPSLKIILLFATDEDDSENHNCLKYRAQMNIGYPTPLDTPVDTSTTQKHLYPRFREHFRKGGTKTIKGAGNIRRAGNLL